MDLLRWLVSRVVSFLVLLERDKEESMIAVLYKIG